MELIVDPYVTDRDREATEPKLLQTNEVSELDEVNK